MKFWIFLSTIPSNLLYDQFWQLAVKFHLWEGVWLNWCSNHGQNGSQSRQHTLQTFLGSSNIYLKFQPFCLKAKCSLIEFKQTKNKTKKQGFLWIKPLYILTKIKMEITGQLKDNMTQSSGFIHWSKISLGSLFHPDIIASFQMLRQEMRRGSCQIAIKLYTKAACSKPNENNFVLILQY